MLLPDRSQPESSPHDEYAPREQDVPVDPVVIIDPVLAARALAALGSPLVVCDASLPDTPVVYANPAFGAVTGYLPPEALGHNCLFLQGEDTDPAAVQEIAADLREGRPFRRIILNYRKDGSPFWNEMYVAPIRDADERPTHFVSVQVDVTERVRAQEALRAATTRLEVLIANIHAGVIVEDDGGQVVLTNQAFSDMMGVDAPPGSLTGANVVPMARGTGALFTDPDGFIERALHLRRQRESVAAEELRLTDGRVWERDYVPVFSGEGHGAHLWLFRDVTERRRAEERLADYAVVLEAKMRELEEVNSRLEEANGRLDALATTDGLTGLLNQRVFHERLAEEFRRARRYGEPLSLIVLDVDRFKAYNDSLGHLAGNAVLRTLAEVLRGHTRETDLAARFGGEEFARLFSVSPEYAAGGKSEAYFRAIHPDDRPIVEQAIAETVAGRDIYEAEHRVVMPDGSYRWLSARGRVERDAGGQAVGLPGLVQDITERVGRQRRERFLTDLAERARGMSEPDAVIADAVRSIGEFLGASRCVFADIDLAADTCSIPPDYRADTSVVSIAGTFPISAFGAFVVAEYKAGRTAVVDDVRADPIKAPPETLGAYDAIGVRAYVATPVMHSARLVSAIAVHSATPRRWKAEEVELIQAVVERAWLTVEVLRQQQALVREAEALREAHGRTAAILESITDAFFALDTNWRFNYMNDEAERLLLRSRSDLLGKVVWDEFPAAVGSVFEQHYRHAVAEQIAVTFEAYYPPPLDAWFEVRAFPSEGGLSAYFHGISDRKAAEKSRDQAQAALLQHEHTIASQLQAALQPEPPGAVPGMRLASHYQAVLPEAGVGGDFFDVFALGKGCTALVLGDLAGKGLAAAAQVATVRNMLRAFLYTRPTVAEAVNDLNRVLAENGLLTGFATLFVGAYDAGTCVLNYCNCGQEPALLRRASSGVVEQLLPTGPVMGAIEGARFSGAMVTLAPGDSLAIFSDGLTECGPDRTAMLNIEGVVDLLAGLNDVMEAQEIVAHLIAGVDSYAGGVISDDQCLLVGIVDG